MKNKFIIIHYPLLDFIIPQAQLSASAYLEETYSVKCHNPYFSSLVIINRDVMLLFDFNNFMHDIFHMQCNPESRFLLISEHKDFSLDNLLTIKKLKIQPPEIKVDYKHFALKTDSEVEFQTLETIEFKTLPAPFRKIYGQRGIMALRFKGETLQYVLDLEKLFINSLVEKAVVPL